MNPLNNGLLLNTVVADELRQHSITCNRFLWEVTSIRGGLNGLTFCARRSPSRRLSFTDIVCKSVHPVSAHVFAKRDRKSRRFFTISEITLCNTAKCFIKYSPRGLTMEAARVRACRLVIVLSPFIPMSFVDSKSYEFT